VLLVVGIEYMKGSSQNRFERIEMRRYAMDMGMRMTGLLEVC